MTRCFVAMNDDPRVQEAFRLLAEVVQEQVEDSKNTQAVYTGWSTSESRRSDFNFEVSVRLKESDILKRTREVEKVIKNSKGTSTFDETIVKFQNGKLKISDWNFVIHSENDTFSAYIMGQGSQQCLTYKSGFTTKDEVKALFNSLGVKHILYGLG